MIDNKKMFETPQPFSNLKLNLKDDLIVKCWKEPADENSVFYSVRSTFCV